MQKYPSRRHFWAVKSWSSRFLLQQNDALYFSRPARQALPRVLYFDVQANLSLTILLFFCHCWRKGCSQHLELGRSGVLCSVFDSRSFYRLGSCCQMYLYILPSSTALVDCNWSLTTHLCGLETNVTDFCHVIDGSKCDYVASNVALQHCAEGGCINYGNDDCLAVLFIWFVYNQWCRSTG